jgi:hypothetical protein
MEGHFGPDLVESTSLIGALKIRSIAQVTLRIPDVVQIISIKAEANDDFDEI